MHKMGNGLAIGLARCGFSALAAFICAGCTINGGTPGGWARDHGGTALDQLVPGQTTRAQVEALLGKPDSGKPDAWEYRSRDASVHYRLVVDFDAQGFVTAVVKGLDNPGTVTGIAAARPFTRDGTGARVSPSQTSAGSAPGATPDYSGYKDDFGDAMLARVNVGKTTKAQVVELLGTPPWRTINYAEPGEDMPGEEQPEIWEWRGRDSNIGPYRVHIEFTADVTSLIAKIPERTGRGWARAAPPPNSAERPNVIDDPSAGMFRYQSPPAPTVNGGDSR